MSHNGDTAQRSYKGFTHAGGVELKPTGNNDLRHAGYAELPHVPLEFPFLKPNLEPTKFKHNEDVVIDYFQRYVEKTYSEHYNTIGGIQAIDVWRALDIDEESFRSNILKYAMRYKYKEGANYKDLLKILHYTTLLMARNHLNEIRSLLDKEKNTSKPL